MFGLFNSAKTADKIVDSAISAGDKLFYTDEEKADARREGFQMWVEYQKVTSGQNVARRWIALVITVIWAMTIVATAISAFFEVSPNTLSSLESLSTKVSMAFSLVTGFYFLKRSKVMKDD